MQIYIHIYIYDIFLINSSIDGHLKVFLLLAIVNNAVLNMGMQIFLPDLQFWINA